MSELVAIDYEKLFKECALARDEAGFLGSVPECIRYLDAEITRLQKELDTAREALEPFAEAIRQADEGAARMGFAPSFDEYEVGWNFSFGQLRRARRALKDKEVAR